MPLKEIRERLEFTQDQIAQSLRSTQGNVSRVENRTDLHVSTVKSYVEAMGGSLLMIAEFPAGKFAITLAKEPPYHAVEHSGQLVAQSERVISEAHSSGENHVSTPVSGKIDRGQINALLDKMLAEVGAQTFSSMKLLQLEAAIRRQNPTVALPGKTVLRECINTFRSTRWPKTAPRKTSRFW